MRNSFTYSVRDKMDSFNSPFFFVLYSRVVRARCGSSAESATPKASPGHRRHERTPARNMYFLRQAEQQQARLYVQHGGREFECSLCSYRFLPAGNVLFFSFPGLPLSLRSAGPALRRPRRQPRTKRAASDPGVHEYRHDSGPDQRSGLGPASQQESVGFPVHVKMF